jgi:hypothetical protein
MSAIVTAYEGRMDMLKAIFGGGQKDAGKGMVKPTDGAGVKALLKRVAPVTGRKSRARPSRKGKAGDYTAGEQ